MTNKLSRSNELLSLWKNLISLLGRAAPMLSVTIVIVTILEALAAIGVLYVIKILIDTITEELNAPESADLSRILFVLAATGAAALGASLLQSLSAIIRMRQGLLVSDYVDREIHDRAITVDLRFYESPTYYDALERARHGGNQRPARAVANLVTISRASLTLAAIFVLIATIEWTLIPILAVPIAIALFIRLHFTRRLFDWKMSKAQMERRTAYLDWLLTNTQHAKDLRINRIGEFLRDQYRSLRINIRQGEISIEQSRLISEFLFATVGTVVFVAASAWLLQQSLQQTRPIGDVALFVLLLRRAQTSGKEFVSNASMIVDDHLFLKRLFDFLSIDPSIKVPTQPEPMPNPVKQGLMVENVSFKYFEAETSALENVNLEIRANQIVALVGENGSGKTTLIKLLARLYDPSEGSISLDGTDIRSFDPVEYRKLMSVIFQDYAMYAETVEENIRFGDVQLDPDEARIVQAAENAGADSFIRDLPNGYKTPLTKLFDNGQDLSIGQWQRLALARAFYPKSQLVILDEPTSAVDPKAEFELFENFRERLGGRSALIISHRLSTIRQADYTYVLENGRIVERGHHDELVKQGGKYADLFEKQAKHYK